MRPHSDGLTVLKWSWPVLALIAGGCTSNLYLPAPEQPQSFGYAERIDLNHVPEPVRHVLTEAAIYRPSTADEPATQISAVRLERWPGCGNPLLGSVATLGLLPVTIEDTYVLSYRLSSSRGAIDYSHTMTLLERTSLWEWLLRPFAHSEQTLLSAALQRSPRRETPCTQADCR